MCLPSTYISLWVAYRNRYRNVIGRMRCPFTGFGGELKRLVQPVWSDTHIPSVPLDVGMITNLAAGQQVFTSNVFLVTGERTVLVDVGNDFDVCSAAREHVDEIDAVVLTHTHPDHVGNLDTVVSEFDVDVWGFDPDVSGVDHAIEDGEDVQLGDDVYTALHTPGHKNDHLCLYARAPGILIAGDLIFANGGFGRTDLEEGDRQQLLESIDRVRETVDDTLGELHCGHGPSVTNQPFDHVELAAQAARFG